MEGFTVLSRGVFSGFRRNNAQIALGALPNFPDFCDTGVEVIQMAGRAPAVPNEIPAEPLSIEERIRRRAHELYLQRNNQEGSQLEDWLQAQAEIVGTQGGEAPTGDTELE